MNISIFFGSSEEMKMPTRRTTRLRMMLNIRHWILPSHHDLIASYTQMTLKLNFDFASLSSIEALVKFHVAHIILHRWNKLWWNHLISYFSSFLLFLPFPFWLLASLSLSLSYFPLRRFSSNLLYTLPSSSRCSKIDVPKFRFSIIYW